VRTRLAGQASLTRIRGVTRLRRAYAANELTRLMGTSERVVIKLHVQHAGKKLCEIVPIPA
jgi:hypothetical protein